MKRKGSIPVVINFVLKKRAKALKYVNNIGVVRRGLVKPQGLTKVKRKGSIPVAINFVLKKRAEALKCINNNGGDDGYRTRDLLRDRQAL